jgi:hypothetical protein
MGKRIRPRGAALSSAYLNETASELPAAEFRNRIADLCPGHTFDEDALSKLYSDFSAVIGKWFSEWSQPALLPIARRLATTARFLEKLAEGLSGVQTGVRQSEDIEFALLARQALSLNPLVGELARADERMASYQGQCSEMAQVFWIAFKTLKEDRGKPGRQKLSWYDDFTALLLKVAKRAKIEPKLNKDRISGARGGWLFVAAQALEPLLYPPMRSESPEACGKRLERSLKRLKAGPSTK